MQERAVESTVVQGGSKGVSKRKQEEYAAVDSVKWEEGPGRLQNNASLKDKAVRSVVMEMWWR